MDEDKKLLVKYGYNLYAQKGLGNRPLNEDFNHLSTLIGRLPPKAKILDLGCGTGIPVDLFLVDKGFSVTGIDISDEMIKLAKVNVPKARFIETGMLEMNFPKKSFNAVVSFHAIYHLPRESQPQLLEKIREILMPGGYLMITMGTHEWEGIRNIYEDIKMFWSNFGKDINLLIVKKAGFNILSESTYVSWSREHQMIFAQKPNF